MRELKIGELAARTGTSVPAIRYYEQIGLLPRAPRRTGGQRVYGRDDVGRVTFIRRCREFDFSIDQVRALVAIVHDPKSSCMDAREMAAGHLWRTSQSTLCCSRRSMTPCHNARPTASRIRHIALPWPSRSRWSTAFAQTSL